MKLTIVVAIYNVKNYLERNLDSLFNQTYRDFQVFCVNDGSTDGSEEIIDKFVAKDSRFIRLDKENGGLSDARNFGLSKCNTEFIMFLDGDDFFELDMVEESLKLMTDDVDMCVFAYNQYYLENNTKEFISLPIKDGVYSLNSNHELLALTPNAAWNKIYRVSLFKDNNIEYPFGYRHQDLGTTPKLLLKARKVAYLNKPLANYLIDRPNNITSQIDNKIYHMNDMCEEIINYYLNENCFITYKEELHYLTRINCTQSLRKAVKLKDRKFVFEFIDSVFDIYKKYFSSVKNKYNYIQVKDDKVYNTKFLCKLYYIYRSIK